MPNDADKQKREIYRALKFFHPDDQAAFELCAINPTVKKHKLWGGGFAGGKKPVVAGWYDNKGKAVEAAAALEGLGCESIYTTLNSTSKALLGRANNRLIAGANRTKDEDVPILSHLLVDIDPGRPEGISSTDQEHTYALEHAAWLKSRLQFRGWPESLTADSGNGAHLVYLLPELENTPENVDLLKEVLQSLDFLFTIRKDLIRLKVDTKVFNPARLIKLYGTTARKGDSTPERPHRAAAILSVPEQPAAVSVDQLKGIIDYARSEGYGAEQSKSTGPAGGRPGNGSTRADVEFNLQAYLGHYGVEIVKEKSHKDGTLFCLRTCLFDASHDGNEAAIFRAGNGKLSYQCFHDSCRGRTWHDARQVISGDDSLGKFCSFQNSRTVRTDKGRFGNGKNNSQNRRLDGSDGSDGSYSEECNILPAVPSFPVEVLPEIYQKVVLEHAAAFAVPVDIPAMALLSAAGACIGQMRGITIKGGWSEYANTYVAIVGRSGIGKSPCTRSIYASIFRLEGKWYREYLAAVKEYEDALEKRKNTPKKHKGDLGPPPDPPEYNQLIIDDSTTEALTDALAQNPRGILWIRDELSGLILDLDKYTGKDGGTKARLMSAYDSGPWKVSRTGKRKFIEKACLSIFGTIQEGALPVIFSNLDAATGFLPRFNFIRAEQHAPPLWTEETVSDDSSFYVSNLFDRLLQYDLENGSPVFIGVRKPAKELFIEWFNEQSLEPWNDCDGAMYEAVLAKLKGQCLRFTLILHCMEAIANGTSERDPIEPYLMTRAITLANYLKEHQKSIWQLCFSGGTVQQLKPFERRIGEAILDLQGEIRAGVLATRAIADHLNKGVAEQFHISPESVGKAYKGMGIESGHLPDRSGRCAKITPEFVEKLKISLGNRPNRPNRPSPQNPNQKESESTVRQPSEPSGKVKCADCRNLNGFNCRIGHAAGGIQLLRQCADYRG